MERQTLLIADCNEDFRLALADELRSQFRIRCCRTGREALTLLRKEAFDLLVLDLNLPELDGLTLLEQMAAEEIRPICLATTRYTSTYIESRLPQLGVSYLILKPCEIPVLAHRVRDLSESTVPLPQAFDLPQILQDLGMPAKWDACKYLPDAVVLYAADPDQSLSKELYPTVGKLHSRSGKNVERSVRRALETAFSKHHDEPAWQKYFPKYTSYPTNEDFIARMAEESLRFQKRSGQHIPHQERNL